MFKELEGMYTEEGKTPTGFWGGITTEAMELRRAVTVQLREMGMPDYFGKLIVGNILPKLLQGRGLPSGETREINKLLREMLLQQAIADLTSAEVTREFEEELTD